MRYLIVILMFILALPAEAQMASLNKAKYLAVLKVVSAHKMGDKDIESDLEKLRESERFKQELEKIVGKLDNSKPNEANNRRIMRILEQAGKDIYNQLK